MHAGKDGYVLTYPHVVAHHSVAFNRQIFKRGRNPLPSAAHYIEGISAGAVHAVVCAVHDKFNALAYRAELAYYEFVAYKFVVMGHVLFKIFRAAVVIICVIADDYVGTGDYIFDKTETADIFVGKYFIRVGPASHKEHLL